MTLRVLAFTPLPEAGAAGRYRVFQFTDPLRSHGVELTVEPFFDHTAFSRLYTPGGVTHKMWDLTRRTPAFHRTAPLNKFTFRVPVAATKTQIRKAVQDAFGVKVISVATQRYKELAARYRFHRGFTAEWKKAIVTIHKEQTLPV